MCPGAWVMTRRRSAEMAAREGVPKAANTVLLGALSTSLNFDPEDWKAVIELTVPPKTIEGNLAAFEAGRVRSLALDEEIGNANELARSSVQVPASVYEPRLEITKEWCKSCDICVRFCPERCLRLDSQQIVELIDPNLCTGCRMCEWLCPDFAINVHLDPPKESC